MIAKLESTPQNKGPTQNHTHNESNRITALGWTVVLGHQRVCVGGERGGRG